MTPRTYRFSPRDTSGWMLGLSGAQCLMIGLGALAASASLSAQLHPVLAVAAMASAAVAAFVPVAGFPLWVTAPAYLGMRRTRKHAVVAHDRSGDRLIVLGQQFRLVDVEAAWAGSSVGVVVNEADATGAVRVAGRAFALADPVDQDRLVEAWGQAVAAFCADNTIASRIVVSAWTGPSSAAIKIEGPPAYRSLVAEASGLFTANDVVIAVTVDARRVRGHHPDRVERAVAEELRLFVSRLALAGLDAAVLDADAIAAVAARRTNPFATRTARASLADVGAQSPGSHRDAVVEVGWNAVGSGSAHRAWEVREWPRAGVHATWLEPLLLGGADARTLVVIFEPVTTGVAHRRLRRDAIRLATDAHQRDRAGFRRSHRSDRAQQLLAEREAELVDGHPDVAISGILIATTPTREVLDERASELEGAAARCGLELRPLHGRHHHGLATAVPVPVAVAGEGWWA